ncbi:hypothetical protein REPUB_Repub08aG0079500 [Reevesia pubescens]
MTQKVKGWFLRWKRLIPLQAENRAIMFGLTISYEFGARKVMLKTYSLFGINLLYEGEATLWEETSLIIDILEFSSPFYACDAVKLKKGLLTRRETNSLAHLVAKTDTGSKSFVSWQQPPQQRSFLSATVRTNPIRPSYLAMSRNNQEQDPLESIFKQKRILRSKVRQALKSMDPSLRSQEGGSMLQTAQKLYVPRVEDKNSHMRMFNISRIDDLVANSMNILEPASVDADGNDREDVMRSNHPVDLFILPGLAFDRSGRRLGRGGGYYDTFLKNYKELAKERNWRLPLFVALSYSVQIMDEEVIPVTPNDVLVDALVSPSGVIPISLAALER